MKPWISKSVLALLFVLWIGAGIACTMSLATYHYQDETVQS